MRLTEELASQLIAEWTNGCKDITPAPPLVTAASPFAHVSMTVLTNRQKLETMSMTKEYGLQLRRAMEGLNALAACAGFDPEENPAFWRCEIHKLSNSAQLQRLTSGLFSHYSIVSDLDDGRSSSSSVAYGLATCLAMDPASPAMAVRRQVIAKLRKYLLRTPPILEIVLGSRHYTLNGCTWHMYMAVIRDLDTIRAMAPALLNAEPLKIVVGNDGHKSAVSADDACFVFDTLHDVAKVMPVEVIGIHIQGPQQSFPIRRLRSLVSPLAGADTVQSMSCHTEAISDVTATILCSAVPYMRSLMSLKLCENRGRSGGHHREYLSIVGSQWLAFALRRRQMQGLKLEISIESERFEAVMRTMDDEQTFACLIPEVVREETAFISFPLGTSAKPTAGTSMTQELLVDHHDQAEGVSASGDRLDVLACSGHRCIVVMPGYGLMWIETDALKSWDRPLDQLYVSKPSPLTMGTLQTTQRLRVSAVISNGSCGLVLSSVFTFAQGRFEAVPTYCSSLRSLTIPGWDFKSLNELLIDPTNGQSTVEALSVGTTDNPETIANLSPCFDAITQPTNPIRHVLRELSIKSLQLSDACLRSLAAALAGNRRLCFLQLRTTARKDSWEDLASKLRIPLGPSTRSKLSIYTFLLSIRRSSRWNCLPFECKRLVVEYAVIQAWRQVALSE